MAQEYTLMWAFLVGEGGCDGWMRGGFRAEYIGKYIPGPYTYFRHSEYSMNVLNLCICVYELFLDNTRLAQKEIHLGVCKETQRWQLM